MVSSAPDYSGMNQLLSLSSLVYWAEMELISPTAALIVLCSVLVTREILITCQCFGYC